MEDFVNKFSEEEKKKIEEMLAIIGWRLSSYEEYIEFFGDMMYFAGEKRKKFQKQMSDILFAMGLARCNMVPVDFKQKEAK